MTASGMRSTSSAVVQNTIFANRYLRANKGKKHKCVATELTARSCVIIVRGIHGLRLQRNSCKINITLRFEDKMQMALDFCSVGASFAEIQGNTLSLLAID